MKKILISAALLALMACTASAQGLNLSWNDCGGAGLHDLNAACTSNSGANTLVGSYIPPAGILFANGNEMVVDLQTNQPALSPWWNMGTATGCVGRTGTPTSDFNFVSGPFSCLDYWGGAAAGGISYNPGVGGPNRARILLICAIQEALAGPQNAPDEFYSFKVIITNTRSVGAPSCAGCTDAACIVLNSIKITQNVGYNAKTLTNGAVSNFAVWRHGLGDCQVTPTRNTTWGSVKSLYR